MTVVINYCIFILLRGKVKFMADMFDRLDSIKLHLEEINNQLMDPNIVTDQNKYRDLMKELKTITPIVETYDKYCKAKDELNEAKDILKEGGLDKEFREMAKQQYDENEEKMEQISKELKVLLLPKDPNDEKNVIIEIRGGAGGDEAALFSANLYRMYTMYAEKRGWKIELLAASETGIGGFKEVSFEITGEGAYSRFKFESGVHRVQRVPETETQGRIHTSTVTVAVLPEAEEVEFDINPNDIQVDTFRASGAGGQHINKTESAIRLTYIPTGLVVECQDERSQFKNKDKAMKILRSRLYEQAQREAAEKIASERRMQVGTGDRSERIRTYNFPQGRVTDHRIGLTLYHLDQIMNGDLDEIIDALITADQALKLSAEVEN